MRHLTPFLVTLLALPTLASAQMSPEEAMARLHDRERAATTQPLQHQVDQLTIQNAALQKQVAALTAELQQLKQQLATASSTAAGTTASTEAAASASSGSTSFGGYTAPPAPSTQPMISASNDSGEYVGPRGGVYHYSASGRKVYSKR